MKAFTAPPEFATLGLDAAKFFYSDKKSFRGPCPNCGGERRFLMFTDHQWPLWHGYCEECPRKIKAWEKTQAQIDPLVYQQYINEREAEERAAAERRSKKLAEFTTQELWAELAARMTNDHIEWWESQGIPEGIQKYLQIGFTPNKTYYDKQKELKHSPAYTIPWFGQNFNFKTMQYRLISPENPKDRYRFEDGLGGGAEHFYMADPSEPIGDKVIICEGAKKAIVTWYALTDASHFTVIAAPSHNTLTPALEATKDCGMRYVILDPGSERKAFEIARRYPKNTKAVYLPEKIDDLYVKHGFDQYQFQNILRAI